METKNKQTRNSSGFTLIELLVVLAIIGLLASVVLVSLQSSRSKARNAKRAGDIAQLASAFSLYQNHCNSYPQTGPTKLSNVLNMFSGTTVNCGNNDGAGGDGGIGLIANATGTVYLNQFPGSPTPVDDGSLAAGSRCSEANGATGVWNDYIYTSTTTDRFNITFCIGQATGSLTAGRHTLTESGLK